jgi:hypothetical protein
MTDKCRIPNFGALVQVSRTLDDTKTEGKHFTSFMLVQTYPFWFTAHLFAGYGIVRLWGSSFPANTGMKIANFKCLPFPFWSPAWFYSHTLLQLMSCLAVMMVGQCEEKGIRCLPVIPKEEVCWSKLTFSVCANHVDELWQLRGNIFHCLFTFFVYFRVPCGI